MFDFVPKNSPWTKQPPEVTALDQQNQDHWAKNLGLKFKSDKKWVPSRLTGVAKMRFPRGGEARVGAATELQNLELINDYPTCGNHFREYCRVTTLHGFRYIMEPRRHNYIEKLIWIFWCIFGVVAAIYMMTKIWTRWDSNPVITSVSSTNYPVSGILFPSVTICSINKAVNEKLIIQGCRYNLTLSQIRTVISMLVDPEARNNDNLNKDNIRIDGKVVLKYLRLVAPKCEDYLISCRWNSINIKCPYIFKSTLTDTGYCCTFNYLEDNFQKKDADTDAEVEAQEKEFEWLQQSVWDYTDRFREKNSVPVDTQLSNITATESFTCSRLYDDDLFPGICRHINKCRQDPKACNLKQIEPTEAPKSKLSDEFPLKAVGAGRSRGLTIMTDTLRCDSVPTGSFKGLRVYVHHPQEFPSVGERGFIVGPGQENNIGINAVDIYSVDALSGFDPLRRGCFFPKEFKLQYYKEYSRSSCVIECENEFIHRECECTPFYSPGNYTICDVNKYINCVKKAIDVIQKRTLFTKKMDTTSGFRRLFQFKNKEESQQDKSCTQFCLPACDETFYNVVLTNAPFPNQPEPNQTKLLREAIAQERTYLNDINYVSGSISVMNFYMRETSIMRYKRDELFTWEDFVSNLGGVMGLCLGFSLLSVIEAIYFFTLRLYIDRKKHKLERSVFTSMMPNENTVKY